MEREKASHIELVKAVDNFPGQTKNSYYEFFLPDDDQPQGYLHPETVRKMPWTEDFCVQHDFARRVTVKADSTTHARDGEDPAAAAINRALARLISTCINQNLFHVLDGKHSEPFAILGANYLSPVHIERFAAPLFGTTQRGAHLLAYVPSTDHENGVDVEALWIPRRAPHLYTSPNLLDTTVGGGIKSGSNPLETIIAEAGEEASLPASFVRTHAHAAGVLTSLHVTGDGDGFPGEKGLVIPDVMYVYDIALPAEMVPRPSDDEVHGFSCMGVAEVEEALRNREFKHDSAAVVVDFLVRHGIITPENEKNYAEIGMHLHRRLPFRIVPKQRGRGLVR